MVTRADSHLPQFHRGDSWKQPVRVATTASITISTALNNGDTIDGVTLATGDRVLVKNQGTGSQNGIYDVGVTPIRSYDFDDGLEAWGCIVKVQAGTTNAGTVWTNTNAAIPTIDSTALTFTQVTGSGSGITFPDLGYFDVKDYGAVGDGSTDDTTAIQSTITACATAGGGTVYFPEGTYLVGGALQDTGAYNAQLLLPTVSTSADQVTIRFLGITRPPFAFHGSGVPANGYSIIKSTLTGASGTAAVISGGNGSAPTQNNVQVVVENLITLLHDNPTYSGWNLSATQAGVISGLQISTAEAMAGTGAQPTHSNSYGIKLAQPYNSNGTKVDGLSVGYFYTGVLQGELATIQGLVLGPNVVGIELQESIHASLILSMQVSGCAYGIRVTGGDHRCDVIQYDSEHWIGGSYASWQNPVYDLDDSGNHFIGHIRWFDVGATAPTAGSFTYDHVFNVNGGTSASYEEIGFTPAGAITVKDEGGALTTAATTLDFVGSGVVASGTGATKTITIGGATAGQLLIADTHSTPLVFADLIQTEAQDDLLYADS